MTRSLDFPAIDRIDTLAQELAMLQDRGKRRIAILGSRHLPVVAVHLVELVARSLAQEGHNLITSGAQGVNAAVIRSVLDIDSSRLTVLLPQSLDRQPGESRELLERVLHLVEKPEHDELPLPMASSLCNHENIAPPSSCRQSRSTNEAPASTTRLRRTANTKANAAKATSHVPTMVQPLFRVTAHDSKNRICLSLIVSALAAEKRAENHSSARI